MLLINRKVNEKIWIGKDICITVVDYNGAARITLGIDAPAEIRISRDRPPEGPPDPPDDKKSRS